MRLKDYFVGQSVRLNSRHSPEIVAERINAAAASRFWPFHSDAIVGGVWFDRISLRYVSSPFEYNAKPVLSGRLQKAPSGSILTLRYRAPAWIYLFDVFWYFFLGLVILMMLGLFGERNPDLTDSDLVFVAALLFVMAIAPVAFHYVGTRKSDEELCYLLGFLAANAEATP